jgi:hypothetical protein
MMWFELVQYSGKLFSWWCQMVCEWMIEAAHMKRFVLLQKTRRDSCFAVFNVNVCEVYTVQ